MKNSDNATQVMAGEDLKATNIDEILPLTTNMIHRIFKKIMAATAAYSEVKASY